MATKRKRATKKPVRRTVRKAPVKRKPSRRNVPSANAVTNSRSKSHDLAAMYLSILIVGVAGIILLVARPTPMMQKVIGILLVILGLWGLMMKKN